MGLRRETSTKPLQIIQINLRLAILLSFQSLKGMNYFHWFDKLKHSTVNPKAFTEIGLYVRVTKLRSQQAPEATFETSDT